MNPRFSPIVYHNHCHKNREGLGAAIDEAKDATGGPVVIIANTVKGKGVDMITAIRNGYLTVKGPPEYASDIGIFMMRIQDLII
ncbi:MAG: hypothetical protein SWH68_01560 [Thermodesulfobacteriota bacterium]|nr:hypothetical protein [Thermodesulfobacteriota bacterium]